MSEVEGRAIELLAELVGIDSVNPGLARGAAGEAGIVEHLRSRLERKGFEVSVVTPAGAEDRPSLIAAPPGPVEWPTVVLNGHLDTVGVEGMEDPFTPRVEGDRMFGRGTADMKGGVAAVVAAAEHLMAAGAPVRPVLALVADEEDASLGSSVVISSLADVGVHPDVCIIAEPTGLALCRSLRGFAVVRVTFRGRAIHSSQPELGVNAVTHLGRFLHVLDQRAEVVRASGGELVVTAVKGGESPFVVPDHAECIVEIRTTADQPSGAAAEEISALLRPEWAAEAQLLAHRDGWRLSTTGPAADLARRLGHALGTAATFDAPYWMEAPLWQERCPTLVCGPTGGGLHAADEWVDLAQVRALASALATVLDVRTSDAH